MSGRLGGTVALVTGASSGIGEATARSLAAQGAKVAMVARRVERLEKIAKEIAGQGHTALSIEADVRDQDQVVAAVERTVGDFGRLDIVVNNAGLMMHAHGMMPLSPPGPYVPMSYQVPVVGHPGLAHPHMAYGEVAYGDVNYVAGHHHQVHRNNHSHHGHHGHHAYHVPGRSHQRAKSRLGGTERDM